jgi:hypothetical protein
METRYQTLHSFDLGDVAGNGLVDRRLFLTAAGAAASGIASPEPASADPLSVGSWMKVRRLACCSFQPAIRVRACTHKFVMSALPLKADMIQHDRDVR